MEYEIDLLSKLVAIDTDSQEKRNYEEMAHFLEKEAKELGLTVKIFPAKAMDMKPRPNVLIEMDKGAKETILVLTHYDIVGVHGSNWKTDPFKLTQKGNLLYGRGSNDDKGGIAAAFGALKELAGKECKRNVKLAVVCDEEVGGKYGTKSLCRNHKKEIWAQLCISMDGGLDNVYLGCSGVVRAHIEIKGRGGHAAYPHLTPNVIHKVVPLLNELIDEYKKIRESKISVVNAPAKSPHKKVWGRFSVTILDSGYKTNVIPERFNFGCDIRGLPEENIFELKKEFRSFLREKLKKYKLHARIDLLASRGYLSNPKNRFVKEAIDCARKVSGKRLRGVGQLGAEDGRHIARIGMPIVSFGPGGRNAHTANEHISLHELKVSKDFITKLAAKDSH